MHYSSRCEKFALATFFNNSQKNIKKSLAQEVCQKRNILVCRIFFYSAKFQRRPVFSEKTVKNCFGGPFNHFLGKGNALPQKLI